MTEQEVFERVRERFPVHRNVSFCLNTVRCRHTYSNNKESDNTSYIISLVLQEFCERFSGDSWEEAFVLYQEWLDDKMPQCINPENKDGDESCPKKVV